MAVAFDATSNCFANCACSISFSHTTGGCCRGLIVGIGYDQCCCAVVSSVTYNSVCLTQVPCSPEAFCCPCATTISTGVWSLTNPASGANTVLVTFSVAAFADAGVISVKCACQTTLLGTVATAQANDQTPTVNVTSETGELVVDVVSIFDGGNALTVDGSQTERWKDPSGCPDCLNVLAGSSCEAGAASVTMSWSIATASARWAMIAVPVNAAAVAAAEGGESQSILLDTFIRNTRMVAI